MNTRYPLAPLAAAMGERIESLGRILNIGGSTWVEYRTEGVSAHVAERLALKAGFHPGNVWPSWYDDELDRLSVECADEKCDERFVPSRSTQRYCCPDCRRRARWRRQQATRRARYPERERARKARWDEESREYRRRYKARWNAENRERVAAHARAYRARQRSQGAA